MAAGKTLESLIVRLVGDGSHYAKTLTKATKDTTEAAATIERSTKKATTAQGKAARETAEIVGKSTKKTVEQAKAVKEASEITKAAARPAQRYAAEVAKVDKHLATGTITAGTHARAIKNLNREYGRGNTKASAFAATLGRVGRSMRKVGIAASLGITLPVVGIGMGFLKAAANAEETQQKFDVVFREVRSGANAAAADLAKFYNMGKNEAKTLLSNTADILKGFGFDSATTLEMSTRVQTLAADLASFSNIEGGVTRASNALTSALLGEAESAKALGVVINQNDDYYKELLAKAKEVEGVSDAQAKAQVALTLAYEQSASAIGDAERSKNSLTNQTKRLKANIKDLATELGGMLVPAARKVVEWVKNVVGWFSRLSTGTKGTIVVMAAVAAAAGPLLLVLGQLAIVIPSIVAATKAAAIMFAGVSAPVLALVAGVGALAVALAGLGGAFDSAGGKASKFSSTNIKAAIAMLLPGGETAGSVHAAAQEKAWAEHRRTVEREQRLKRITAVRERTAAMVREMAQTGASTDAQLNFYAGLINSAEAARKLDADAKNLRETLAELDKIAKIELRFSVSGVQAVQAGSAEAMARLLEFRSLQILPGQLSVPEQKEKLAEINELDAGMQKTLAGTNTSSVLEIEGLGAAMERTLEQRDAMAAGEARAVDNLVTSIANDPAINSNTGIVGAPSQDSPLVELQPPPERVGDVENLRVVLELIEENTRKEDTLKLAAAGL